MDLLFHSVRVIRRLSIKTSGYEELKNAGFDIIRSEPLKQEILDLFESTYFEAQKIFDDVPLYTERFSNYVIDHFLEMRYDKLKPVHYERVMNDHFYYSSLLHIRSIRGWRILLIESALEHNQKVLELIKSELKG